MPALRLATVIRLAAAIADAAPDPKAVACGRPCREHPQLSGSCSTIRGRMNSWNGAPSVRIWRVGTTRILGVSDKRFRIEGFCNLPLDLLAKLSWETDLFGDFTVCPFTEVKPGGLQLVCVDSGANLTVRRRDP
jgi:hypothetical protein